MAATYTIEQHYSFIVCEEAKRLISNVTNETNMCIIYPSELTGEDWLHVWFTNKGQPVSVIESLENGQIRRLADIAIVPIPEDLKNRRIRGNLFNDEHGHLKCKLYMNFEKEREQYITILKKHCMELNKNYADLHARFMKLNAEHERSKVTSEKTINSLRDKNADLSDKLAKTNKDLNKILPRFASDYNTMLKDGESKIVIDLMRPYKKLC